MLMRRIAWSRTRNYLGEAHGRNVISFLRHVAGLSLRLWHQTEAVPPSPFSAVLPVAPAFH